MAEVRPCLPSELRSFEVNNNQFVIEVLKTLEAKEQAFELIWQQLLQVYPQISALNVLSEPGSRDAVKDWVFPYLNQNIAIGCYSSNKKLIAVDVLNRRQFRASALSEFPGEAYDILIKCLNIKHKHVQAYFQKIDQNNYYLTSLGIFTEPRYNSLQIVEQMIFTRKFVAKYLGIEVIAGAFIGKQIQELVKSHKYTDIKLLNREEMLELGLERSMKKNSEEFCIKIMGVVKTKKREINSRKIRKTRRRKNEIAGTLKVLLSKPYLQPPSDDSDVNDD